MEDVERTEILKALKMTEEDLDLTLKLIRENNYFLFLFITEVEELFYKADYSPTTRVFIRFACQIFQTLNNPPQINEEEYKWAIEKIEKLIRDEETISEERLAMLKDIDAYRKKYVNIFELISAYTREGIKNEYLNDKEINAIFLAMFWFLKLLETSDCRSATPQFLN